MGDIPGADGIPEWVFWIGAALGTSIGALVVRLGWRSGAGTNPPTPLKQEGTTFIDRVGVLVDNGTIEVLAGSIEGLGVELMAAKKEHADRQDKIHRVGERLADELSELRHDIRELARAYRSPGGQLPRR